MYGNDHYSIKLGINENVPFRNYGDDYEVNPYIFHIVNVVAMNDKKERATCIVVKENGKYADFYYNGSEENFKPLSESGFEDNSWEDEMFGTTPECILKYGVSTNLQEKLTGR